MEKERPQRVYMRAEMGEGDDDVGHWFGAIGVVG